MSPLNSQTNAVLADFAIEWNRCIGDDDKSTLLCAWISWFRDPYAGWDAEHIAHARKVLLRLLSLIAALEAKP